MEGNITEDEIMSEIYNFILDPNITNNERKIFIEFKNNVGKGAEFNSALMGLSYDLRQIAIKNLSKHTGLTPSVSEFYKKIVSYGQLKLNWARGLASYGMIF